MILIEMNLTKNIEIQKIIENDKHVFMTSQVITRPFKVSMISVIFIIWFDCISSVENWKDSVNAKMVKSD